MNYLNRISKVYNSAERIYFDDSSRFILMSDCHRGDGSWSDSFSRNRNIFFAALSYYYKRDYTYIELGDGDELWENRSFRNIVDQHRDAFWIMKEFYDKNRFYMIYGNHDMVKKKQRFVEENLYQYLRQRDGKLFDLFKDIKVHEGLVLEHRENGKEILLLHGHQVDFLNSSLWKLARFLVRYFWKPLENFGVNDVTRTAKNYEKKNEMAKRLTEWAIKENKTVIAGHNHKPMLNPNGTPMYFNDGSCVHPRCITGLEIADGSIQLVKWSVKARDTGELIIDRDVLSGPVKIKEAAENTLFSTT